MAQSALGGETCSDVLGIGGPGEVRLMAAIAGGWQRCVVVIGMALRATYCGVRSSQRE